MADQNVQHEEKNAETIELQQKSNGSDDVANSQLTAKDNNTVQPSPTTNLENTQLQESNNRNNDATNSQQTIPVAPVQSTTIQQQPSPATSMNPTAQRPATIDTINEAIAINPGGESQVLHSDIEWMPPQPLPANCTPGLQQLIGLNQIILDPKFDLTQGKTQAS